MTEIEKENLSYLRRIDEIYEKFKTEKTFFAKKWVERLTAADSNGVRPNIYIWGAGQLGGTTYNRFFRPTGIGIFAAVDSAPEKWGKVIWESIPIISPQEVEPSGRIVIAVNGHHEEIRETCLQLGMTEDRIFDGPISVITWMANYQCSVDDALCERMVSGARKLIEYFGEDRKSKDVLIKLLSHRLINSSRWDKIDKIQYFIPELPIRANEKFVDAGAYNGDTLRDFIACSSAEALTSDARYYAFECEKENVKDLEENIAQIKCNFSIRLYPIALWDKEEILNFSGGATSGMVDTIGGGEVTANCLDNILAGKRITWIKMDIEGAEMRALHGCASIIKEQKPRLAICIYHEPSDLYTIPQYIKSLRNDYKMLIRHHSDYDIETVLYAY